MKEKYLINEVTLDALDADGPDRIADSEGELQNSNVMGLVVENINADRRRELGDPEGGVVISDIESDTATLGKQQGADIALNKPTYPSLLGLEGAKEKATQLHRQALTALEGMDQQAEPLRELASYIIARKN